MRDYYRILGNAIGEGSYGQVFKCVFIKSMADQDYLNNIMEETDSSVEFYNKVKDQMLMRFPEYDDRI